MGKLLFQITGAFAEFERSTIRKRITAGLKTVKAAIATKGSFVARNSGIVRKRLGRPSADPKKVEAARRYLAQGMGVLKTDGLRAGFLNQREHYAKALGRD
jgi:DNA invertase Pin-like site-specific DNA recombinase